MNDAMDITGDPDRMCADFPAQKTAFESFERERAAKQPPAETEAMGQMLMEAISREIAIRARLIEAERLLKAEIAQ